VIGAHLLQAIRFMNELHKFAERSLAKGGGVVKPGPFRLGAADLLERPSGLTLIAATYGSTFRAGIKCYPYFTR
jgi:hypothetical protein